MAINIAIDGPSAAGKSTIAEMLAEKYHMVHLDTGAMYRLVAYKATKSGIDYDDEDALEDMIFHTSIKMEPDGSMYLDGEPITSEQIRTDEMSMASSAVSRHKKVRAALVAMQQEISKDKGYILDGRDIGTVVLKDAEVKIFLVASAEARARRRIKQNLEKGLEVKDFETVLKEIQERDLQDSTRENSPLVKADDAIEVDNSDGTLEELLDKISVYVDKALLQ
ncbi:MAG: (d)CMP kinase [Erysipelotrichaceae bacterium]|jgi:cytidylate kinase|nr:(d)CMP kinase [Erysipelotrichaceae bacterium]